EMPSGPLAYRVSGIMPVVSGGPIAACKCRLRCEGVPSVRDDEPEERRAWACDDPATLNGAI
ncbi:MAG: hypothetical protein ACRDG9_14485, partial [Actinomycetota bacterium]